MADDYVSLAFNILIWMLFTMIVFGPFVVAFIFRNKVSFWPGRKVIKIQFYRLMEGKKMDDTGHVNEKDCKLDRGGIGWRITQSKIPWIWIETSPLNGFQMDAAGLALLRAYDKPTLRLLEMSPENKTDPSNYAFMDIPQTLDAEQVRTAVSTMANSLIKVCKAELTRPQKDTQWTDAIIAIMPYIALVVIFIFAFNYLSGLYSATVQLGTTQLTEVCRNAVSSINWSNVTTPVQTPPALPFKVGG